MVNKWLILNLTVTAIFECNILNVIRSYITYNISSNLEILPVVYYDISK